MKIGLLLLILLYWCGILFILIRWRVSNALTISQHAAQTKTGQRFFLLLNLICIPLSWWLLLQLFVPLVRFPMFAAALYSLMAVALIGAACIPETDGWRVVAHRRLAFTMAYSFIPFEAVVVVSPLPLFIRVVAAALGYFICVAAKAFKTGAHRHDQLLIFQTSNIAALHCVVLLTVFYG